MELTKNQEIKVKKIIEFYQKILNNEVKEENKIFFSSPTGSGKTFMISNVIWDMINNNEKIAIFFTTLSSGMLQKQNYDSYKKYLNNTNIGVDKHYFNVVDVDYKITGTNQDSRDIKQNNIFVKDKKQLYFLGTQQYTESSILYKKNLLQQHLKELKKKNYKIIYIRDESHIGAFTVFKKTETKNLNNLFEKYSDCSIFTSATMNSFIFQPNTIIFTLEEAIEDKLIKSELVEFENIKENSEITSSELTDIALSNFKKHKEDYFRAFQGEINPALLIQIPSKSEKNSIQTEELLIKNILYKIKKEKLNYYIWTDNISENIELTNVPELMGKKPSEIRDIISENKSYVDIIIFKVALAIGWNIPRANSLLQLRELHSEELNIQTIGRIRRNPLKNIESIVENEYSFCDKYFIYSNNNNYISELKSVYLKPEYAKETFNHSNLSFSKSNYDENEIRKKIQEFLISITWKDMKSKKIEDSIVTNSINIKKNINFKIVTNQIFWEFEFNSIFKSSLNSFFLNILYEEIDNFISNNIYLLDKKHKIFKFLILNQSDIVDIFNKNIVIQSSGSIKSHTLPIRTNVELVLEEKKVNSSIYSKARRTFDVENNYIKVIQASKSKDLSNYLKNFKDIDDKWAYDEKVDKSSNEISLNKIHLDSSGEYNCCKEINDFFIKNKNHFNNLKFFTKHYISSSQIKYSYVFKEENKIKRIFNTYPDFLVVLEKNQQKFNFVIEVKSKNNDYNVEKTLAIEEMFADISRLDEYKNYFFCLYKYGGKEEDSNKISVFSNNSNKYEVNNLEELFIKVLEG